MNGSNIFGLQAKADDITFNDFADAHRSECYIDNIKYN